MAEALGVASGVVGIVSFGIQLCQGLLEYYGSWKDAESEIATTCSSIQDLTKILLLVKSTLDNQGLKAEIVIKIHDSIALCEGGIAQLNKKLQKIQIVSLRDTVGERFLSQARRALYPFKKSTLIKLQEIVDGLQNKLHLTLTVLDINVSLQNFDHVSGQLRILSIKADEAQTGLGNIKNSLVDLDRKIDTIESLYGGEYLRNFCKWLSPVFDVFEKRQHDIYELPGRQDGTWEWLQSTQEFKDWLSRANRILWCPGQPGVGKTVLSSSIINHLETRVKRPGIGIAYIYCDYNNALLTVANFISNLLQQLFRQSPKLPGNLLDLYKGYTTRSTHLSLREYSAFLRDAIESFSEVFIVVDGLDECPSHGVNDVRDQLLDQLKELPLKSQVLFTSRELPAIALKFATDQRLEIHASRHAIEGYLQARINSSKNLRLLVTKKPGLQHDIVEMVATKADGMFLLVRMYIDLLATKKVLGMLEKTLRNLPEGLKELDTAYDDVITRIRNQDDDDAMMAKQILTWLYYAVRPLSLQELRHSLAVNLVAEADPDATELDEDFLPDEELILSVCAGIVTCHAESNTVSFIHYTTKEYFRRRIDRQEIERFLHLEISIAETCLMYLSFERKEIEQYLASRIRYPRTDVQDTLTIEKDIYSCYPLFRYAARYWGHHVNGILRQATKDLYMKFIQKQTCLTASVQALAQQEKLYMEYLPQFTGLCLASFFGLKEIVMMLLEDDQYVEEKNDYDWTALHMASERGHAAIIQPLIDNGADVNLVADVPSREASGTTALHLAARGDHETVLEILLNNGVEVDLQAERDETALHYAARNGRVGAINFLLDRGASLEAKSSEGFTPLRSAAEAGKEAAAKVLIERGADLLGTTGRGHSLLHLAAEGGCVEVARLLLERGFDVDYGSAPSDAAASQRHERDDAYMSKSTWTHTDREETALHRGATKGHDTVVRLLLENGAEVDARNKYGQTALHFAVGKGHEAVVQVLVLRGADANIRDEDFGETVLHSAARFGRGTIVQILLKHGADVNMKSRAGKTALHLAARWGSASIVQTLLEHGADVNVKTKGGKTALHLASKRGFETVVRMLLENGADAAAKTKAGKTALEVATLHGHEAIERLLLDHLEGETNSEARLATSEMPNVAS